MNLLALDASTEMASVAVLAQEALYFEEQGSQKTHAQHLLPMVDRLLTKAGVELAELDAIVFGCGPGSFTGLRIACSMAKGLAYAYNLPLIPVSSLSAIAYSARELSLTDESPVLAVLDARMQEMYWSYFDKGQWMGDEKVDKVEDIQVTEHPKIILAGVGIETYWSDFPYSLKSKISSNLTLYPSATAMIRLAQTAGIKPVSVAQAQPVYVRNQVTQGAPRG